MQNFIEYLYSRFLLSDGVSIDTRTLVPGNIFFALSGPNFNGNAYAEEALKKGASFAVIDDPDYKKDDRMVLAEDSLQALQQLSVFHRERFKRPVFALTGSNGKTSTKELITRVLEKRYIVHATSGNFNNHIGVPLTILGIHPQAEIAIIEMGASQIGDIAELCSYARPTHGLITNIGRAHTETFGGIEGVLRGKTELFDFLLRNNGQVFINDLDSRLKHLTRRFTSAVIYPEQDVKSAEGGHLAAFMLGRELFQTQMVGGYNFPNIAAAMAVGRFFDVADADITTAICDYKPDNLRSQIVQKRGFNIIVDAYNANPDSMKAAIENLAAMAGKRAVVLGDMLELEHPEQAHQELGALLRNHGIESVICIGPWSKHIASEVPGSEHFENVDLFKSTLNNRTWDGFNILVKGSRKLKLESLIDLF